MKKALGILFILSLIVCRLSAQTAPSFSIIGTKEKLDGFANIRCLYVRVINYDVANPKDFEAIRRYIRDKGSYYPDDFVHIFIFDRYENIDNCECGGSNDVQLAHLIADAYLQDRVPDHNYKRLIRVTPNSMYGSNGSNVPKGVSYTYSDDDSYWY